MGFCPLDRQNVPRGADVWGSMGSIQRTPAFLPKTADARAGPTHALEHSVRERSQRGAGNRNISPAGNPNPRDSASTGHEPASLGDTGLRASGFFYQPIRELVVGLVAPDLAGIVGRAGRD